MTGPRLQVGLMTVSIALLAVSACTSTPAPVVTSTPPSAAAEPSVEPTGTSGWIADSAAGFTFRRPTNWQLWQPNAHDPMTSGPLVYLSTEPLLASCAVAPGASPNLPDSGGEACAWPFAELEPGGTLVTLYTTRLLVPLPTDGVPITVNGARAVLQVAEPGPCAQIGGERTDDVLIPMGQAAPRSNVGATACMLGPDLDQMQSQFEALLSSLTAMGESGPSGKTLDCPGADTPVTLVDTTGLVDRCRMDVKVDMVQEPTFTNPGNDLSHLRFTSRTGPCIDSRVMYFTEQPGGYGLGISAQVHTPPPGYVGCDALVWLSVDLDLGSDVDASQVVLMRLPSLAP